MASTINAKTTGVGGIDASGDASGVLSLQTGGVTALTISTSQNVGIGTTSPQNKFVVSNAGAAGMEFVPSYTGLATAPAIYSYNRSGATWTPFVNLATSHYWGVGATPNASLGMLLDTSGNLGLGVTPSAWGGGYSPIQSQYGILAGNTQATILSNAYFNSGYKYVNTNYAAQYLINTAGQHQWYTAPSGTAGNPITFTQTMTLFNSGCLSIGNTTDASANNIMLGNSSSTSAANFNALNSSGQTSFGTQGSSGYGALVAGDGFIYTSKNITLMTDNASSVIKFASGGSSEKMRLNARGDLGIAVTPSAWNYGNAIDLGSYSSFSNAGGYQANIANNAYAQGSSPTWYYKTSGYEAALYTQAAGQHDWFTAGTGTAGNAITFNIGLRLNAARNLLHATSFTLNSTNSGFYSSANVMAVMTNGNSQDMITFYTNVTSSSGYTYAGKISSSSNTTSYTSASDYRLKDNQEALTGSGAFIDALQPKTWDWANGEGKGVGFIAHEVQEISPSSVVGEKDAIDEEGNPSYQSMEYGSAEFIANIVAELQSLRKRVAELEGTK